MSERRPIEHVVIVGGGTAGWMTAASLSQRLSVRGVKITLVESSDIGTVGVGEATVPAILAYFASLGLKPFDVMAATNATCKLGIEFDGWRKEGHTFYHPFGRHGIEAGPVGFHSLWQKLHEAGEPYPLSDYCLATEMSYQGRFRLPDPKPRAAFDTYDWAIHFDASLFAKFLRGYATERGVMRIDAKITGVEQNSESGFIERLQLNTGEMIEGDLFIDCSGFRGLLIQGALKSGFNDWSHWLVCDRAVAIPCAYLRSEAAQAPRKSSGGPKSGTAPLADANSLATGMTPYTRSRAKAGGWTWRIPLQHRIGNGYVYSSQYLSDAEAEATLRADLDGEALANPNFVRFTAGHSKQFWNKNCIAIGLASGFLEPLESTSITLIQTGIAKLLQYFPHTDCDPQLSNEYNRISALEYERIRDFIILHYWGNQRFDEPKADNLWRHCREMTLPDGLQHKIDLFKSTGHFARYQWESFFDPSWLYLYDGLGITPQSYDPFADNFALQDLKDLTANIRADVKAMAMDAPLHADFVRQHCPAKL